MKKSEIAALMIVLLSFAISIYLFPLMPEQLASHWNALGEVNGYMPKLYGMFLMPIISAALLALFILMPRIDPLKANIKKFIKYFDAFVVLILLFMLYIHLLTIFWNFGMRFNLIQFMSPAFGILFYFVGVLTEKAKRNWFIGIRTPWSMSNEKVWNKTNMLGGMLFKISGAIAFFGVLLPDYAIWFVLVPVVLTTVFTVVYSYVEYQKYSK